MRIVLVLALFILIYPQGTEAFIGTSTSFTSLQGIQSIMTGSTTNPFSSSASFLQLGLGGGTAVGTSTSASFLNYAGILSAIAKTKNAGEEISLTFTVDSNTKNFGTLSPGNLVSNITSLYVTTNNSSGFTTSVYRVDSDATLDLTTNSTVNIPDKTAWVPGGGCGLAGNATASTTESQTLQFRVRQAGTDSGNYCSAWWGSDDTTPNARFAGFPTTDQDIVYRSSPAVSEVTSVLLYNLDVPNTQETGSYTGTITFTTVANP